MLCYAMLCDAIRCCARLDLPAFDAYAGKNAKEMRGARRVFRSHSSHAPCLPEVTCDKVVA